MVPLINIEEANSRHVIYSIGERLMSIFAKAHDVEWDKDLQIKNMKALVTAEEEYLFETPKPRFFVYQYCRFLDLQKDAQRAISEEEAGEFVNDNEPPLGGDDA